ncbi:MAG: CPBP family intramembrane metalloprotease [Candidatus Omnitrophica bacterium]|nr:CPBP family intramembrane metalloprotease [Candidatus Omnitrophota bacterium]
MKPLRLWLAAGILGLVIFVFLFSHAFPVASVDIQISREEALQRATTFIQSLGYDLEGFSRTVIFYSDYRASVYLQKTQGIKRSNELIKEGVPVWFWQVRWFKELEKEGFLLRIDPTSGELIYFNHFVLDDAKGADLTRAKAMRIAAERVRLQGIDLQDYELKDSTVKKQINRTDYRFAWEKKDHKIEEATLRVDLDVYGDSLGKYRRYLKVPEEFERYLKKELSFGRMLSTVTNVLKYFLITIAVFMLFFKSGQAKADWKLWVCFGATAALFELFDFFNSLPLWWNFYPDTMSKAGFIIESFAGYLTNILSIGLIILACGALGQLSLSESMSKRMPLFSALRTKNFDIHRVKPTFIVGYSLAFIFLGYVTLFYLLGTKVFNIWIPPDAEYSNIFAMILPFLFPLTIAISAAIKEEFLYRFFAIPFLTRFTKKLWLAILLPALIWGFAHSFYHIFPTYVRGIELTIFGVVMGMVFLRYGIETVIIAHFVMNATLAGLPLLRSHNSYFVISGVIVIALAFVPVILVSLFRKRLK